MERFIQKSERKKAEISTTFVRYLSDEIEWNQRMILLLGHRGVGKTTLLLQQLKKETFKSIYISLDDYYFEEKRLIEVIEILYSLEYKAFYIDEIHRYANWSKDLKNLYDDYSDSRFIITGSSILKINKGQEDLSRRAVVYHLAGLSLREFIAFEEKIILPTLTINDIVSKHREITTDFKDQISYKSLFDNYLKYGYYPFYKEGKRVYHQKLQEATNLVIDSDIAPFEELNYTTVRVMKKLLFIISQSVPFIPNISKLAEKLNVSRNTILKLLDILDQAQLISLLHASTDGISFLQKPEKIYLQNTNLSHMFAVEEPNLGNIRETFFFNQLKVKHTITAPKYGDFMVENQYIFEVGGPNKTNKQLRGVPQSYLAIDGIEGGVDNRIPLWIFGFLY
ncbi:MAG: ATP-binding protein [Flavobacteriia bacterium]|nr:ATP-binding protein [Flavobacteriia bacterium]